jgi:hypothetical protein
MIEEKLKKLFSYLPPSINDVRGNLYENGNGFNDPYIQHTPEIVEEVQAAFIELCVQEGVLPEKFLQGKVHRQSIIGRYLDDSNSIFYKHWYRFMCIDEKYREWQQPYFAINIEKEGKDFHGLCINTLSPELIEFFRDQKINEVLS